MSIDPVRSGFGPLDEAIRSLRSTPTGRDLSASILSRVEAKKPFRDRAARVGVGFFRAAAAGAACGLIGVTIWLNTRVQETSLSPLRERPMSMVLRGAGEDAARGVAALAAPLREAGKARAGDEPTKPNTRPDRGMMGRAQELFVGRPVRESLGLGRDDAAGAGQNAGGVWRAGGLVLPSGLRGMGVERANWADDGDLPEQMESALKGRSPWNGPR